MHNAIEFGHPLHKIQAHLAKEDAKFEIPEEEYPLVTVQLPVYNELYVVERLIDAIAAFDYPKNKLEIQLLDDSTDESFEIALRKVEYYQNLGIDIVQIKRPERKGFKAGALEYGLKIAKANTSQYLMPTLLLIPIFLKNNSLFLEDNKIGVVQAKWEHLNKDYSILTKMQAFALDMHLPLNNKVEMQQVILSILMEPPVYGVNNVLKMPEDGKPIHLPKILI